MKLLVGLVVIVLMGIAGYGLLVVFISWLILKWLVILLAIGGGLLGYAIFHDLLAVWAGAAIGVVVGFAGLSYLGKRLEDREDVQRPPKRPVEDHLAEMARSVDRKLQAQQERYEARQMMERKQRSADLQMQSKKGSTDGWLRRSVRRMLG